METEKQQLISQLRSPTTIVYNLDCGHSSVMWMDYVRSSVVQDIMKQISVVQILKYMKKS